MKNGIKPMILATIVFAHLQAFGQTKEMRALIDYETKSNAVATRSNVAVAIENYEIPLALVESNLASNYDQKILESLTFKKGNSLYVRWLINPEDTKWYKDVEKFLKENNVSIERHKYFKAYQTASRSYAIIDPQTKFEFTAKVSTDKTGGNWTDKKNYYVDSWQTRMVTDFLNEQIKNVGQPKNITFIEETAVFGLKQIDQAMSVREYGKLSNSGKIYLPGFSALHDKTGKEIAKLNGSNDPASFWNEHYNKPLARAIAEFAVLTGMAYDSPHSQNFLIELTSDLKPTGKIVFRDFGDVYLSEDFMKAKNKQDILTKWADGGDTSKGYLSVSVGVLHGNEPPSWISTTADKQDPSSYDQWRRDFFVEFEKEFKEQTGIDINPQKKASSRNGNYFNGKYDMKSEAGTKFIELVKKDAQRSLKAKSCQGIYASH